MTHQPRHRSADSFADAWAALVEDDRAVTAPPELEPRVLAAVRARQAAHTPRHHHQPRPSRMAFAAAAAGLALAAVTMLLRTAPVPEAEHARSGADATAAAPPTTATEVVLMPELAVAPGAGTAGSSDAIPAAAPIVTLAIDDAGHAESLQLVRVRMPRAALGTLGLALYDPEATGMVDVDIVVGDDGLPRDIRHIQPVIADIEE